MVDPILDGYYILDDSPLESPSDPYSPFEIPMISLNFRQSWKYKWAYAVGIAQEPCAVLTTAVLNTQPVSQSILQAAAQIEGSMLKRLSEGCKVDVGRCCNSVFPIKVSGLYIMKYANEENMPLNMMSLSWFWHCISQYLLERDE